MLLFLLGLCPCSARAADGWGAPMLLEIWVNGHTRHVTAQVVQNNDILFVPSDDLTSSGLVLKTEEIPPCKLVALNRIADLKAEISFGEQKLLITAPADRLEMERFDLQENSVADRATSDTGFIGSYNLVGTTDDFNRTSQTTNLGATLGGTVFTPEGFLSSNGFVQSQTGLDNFTRLDTAAEFDQPGSMRRWVAGDAVSGSLNWSRAVRLGGFQVASDFSMRPDLNTMPLPAFFGKTAVPATVDVYVNAARVFETNVDSGPFQINNLPIITGNGQVNIVTRDVLGQEVSSVLPFYASNQLLKSGLSSYDFDAGLIRRSYGTSSFDYGPPAATGTYSYGFSNDLTLESHTELSGPMQLAGGGAIFPVGTLGVMHLAASGSTYDDNNARQNGAQFSVSAESQPKPFGLFATASKTVGSYNDIATFGSTSPPVLQMQFGGNVGFDTYGSTALSWIETKSAGTESERLLSASYTVSFWQRWNFGLTSFYDMTNKTVISEALISLSFDNNLLANSQTRIAHDSNQQQVGLIKPVSTDGGVGYQLSGAVGQPDQGLAEMTWVNSRGTLDGAFSSQNGVQAGRLTASGGIVAMGSSVYATQYPNGAVALVRTGQPDTHVLQENRDVGTTDEDGELLLTNFTPFTVNHIGIDPRDFAMTSSIDDPQKTFVPRRQSGVIVDMSPVQHQPAILVLHRDSGDYPPTGARVTLEGSAATVAVGRHGEVYLEDLDKPLNGLVQYADGSCRFQVAPPERSKDDPIPRIDPVACVVQVP